MYHLPLSAKNPDFGTLRGSSLSSIDVAAANTFFYKNYQTLFLSITILLQLMSTIVNVIVDVCVKICSQCDQVAQFL